VRDRRKSGRRKADRRASDAKVTLTNERSAGSIIHDERGDARWTWATESPDTLERTFDELKALDNETLTLLDSDKPAASRPIPGGGYNPYDAVTDKKVKPKIRR
jgi:hypothetical protein